MVQFPLDSCISIISMWLSKNLRSIKVIRDGI